MGSKIEFFIKYDTHGILNETNVYVHFVLWGFSEKRIAAVL